MRRRSVTSDTMPLISTVPSGRRRVAARSCTQRVIAVGADQAVLDVAVLAGGERAR